MGRLESRFSHLPDHRLDRAVDMLELGQMKAAARSLGVTKNDLDVQATAKRNSALRDAYREHYSHLGRNEAAREIEKALNRFSHCGWRSSNTQRHNPYPTKTLNHFLWECLKHKNTIVSASTIKSILIEKTSD